MKFQEPRRDRDLGPVERDDVVVSTNRCPFCHDDVAVEGDDWVACYSCQARHHRDCWQEGTGCGSCGETRFVAVPTTPTLAPTDEARPPGPLGIAARVCGVAGLALLVAEGAFDLVVLRSGLCWLFLFAWFALGVMDRGQAGEP